MVGAKHEQAVGLLTGLERFVRLVVEREIPISQANPANLTPSEKSPRIIGAPKPYTGLYSPNSYMANRPGYMGYNRTTPESERINTSGPSVETSKSPVQNDVPKVNNRKISIDLFSPILDKETLTDR